MPSLSSTKAPKDVTLVTVPCDDVADLEESVDVRPRIGRELLHAQADALLLGIDVQDDGVDFVALLQDFGRDG